MNRFPDGSALSGGKNEQFVSATDSIRIFVLNPSWMWMPLSK